MLPSPLLTQSMRRACAEARQWLGATSPNPAVGAVALNAEGSVIASATHHRAGDLHAEAKLIAACKAYGTLANIHTLCVTLEPCNHQGRQPPCVDAILQSGIKHIVIGTRDCNPHVLGGGVERLRQSDIDVRMDVNEEECKRLIHAFAYKVQTGKPWITVKRAFDRKGSMIPPAGQKTFTSPDSLRLAHRLRKKSDAIVTGSGTILADNPLFTVRHVVDYPGKRRWLGILDRRDRVPESYIAAAHERGFDVVLYQDARQALADLTQKGAQDILVEAGPSVSDYMLQEGLWTIAITVRQADPADTIDVTFNENQPIPFSTDDFVLEEILPT